MIEQIFESGVRLLRRSETAQLAEGPQAGTVHLGINASRIRKFARVSEVAAVLRVRKVLRAVTTLDSDSGLCGCCGRGVSFPLCQSWFDADTRGSRTLSASCETC